MRKTTPARRKGAVKVILFGVLAAAVILLAGALGRRSADTAIRAGTNEERIAYLRSLGWEVVRVTTELVTERTKLIRRVNAALSRAQRRAA